MLQLNLPSLLQKNYQQGKHNKGRKNPLDKQWLIEFKHFFLQV